MLNDFDTADLLSSRRDDVTPEDERTVSDLMVDQIEFADIIVLNKIDMVSNTSSHKYLMILTTQVQPSQKNKIIKLVKNLNHRAKIIESTYGKVDVTQLVNTGLFKLEIAQAGYGWLQDLHAMTVSEVNGKNVVTPKPETEEYNVQSFIYSRYRPFHPKKLYGLLHDKFILQLEHPEDDDDGDEDMMDCDDEEEDDSSEEEEEETSSRGRTHSSASSAPSPTPGKEDNMEVDTLDNATILANKRSHPTLSRLFRSKGEFLLATRPHRAGEWSQAGGMLTMTGGRPWFCTIPEEEYTTGNKEVDALVQHDIAKGGEWGDRRQELVFIGEGLDHKGLEVMLDACLLSDEEYESWKGVMRSELSEEDRRDKLEELFEDGFPDWPDEDEDHEGHDHGPVGGKKELRSITQALQEVS